MFNRWPIRQRQVEDVKIPVVGIEHAPALVDWLRQQAGVEVIEGPADPAEAVRTREEDVVVVIPKDFVKKFPASKPARRAARRRHLEPDARGRRCSGCAACCSATTPRSAACA